jgi:c(7)-type cytochrome triheme protein
MARTSHDTAYLCATAIVIAVLGGCGTPNSVLDKLFVPLPPAPQVKNQPRHPPPPKREVAPPLVVQEVVAPPPIDWTAVYQTLPRDKKSAVDWMTALAEKQITPKPGIDPAAEEASIKEEEQVFFNTETPSKVATFRHATHTQWLSCKNCHPAIFKKRDENLQFTHDDMDAGKYCGACHFRVVVVQSGCTGCHPKKAS